MLQSIMQLHIEIVPGAQLRAAQRAALYRLLERAYEEGLEPLYRELVDPVHVMASSGDELVGHAMWVTRWLQPGTMPALRTAYIEGVATAPQLERRGIATAVMRELQAQLDDYELGGLSPATQSLYLRLGWQMWRGPLAIRTEQGLLPTPDEELMILRLPRTPALDLDDPMTAEWRPGELW